MGWAHQGPSSLSPSTSQGVRPAEVMTLGSGRRQQAFIQGNCLQLVEALNFPCFI